MRRFLFSWLIKPSLLSTDIWQPLEIEFILVAGLSGWNSMWICSQKEGSDSLLVSLCYTYTKAFWTLFTSPDTEEISWSWQEEFSALLVPYVVIEILKKCKKINSVISIHLHNVKTIALTWNNDHNHTYLKDNCMWGQQTVCGDTAFNSRVIGQKILEKVIYIFHTCFQKILSFTSFNAMHPFVSCREQNYLIID